jgi:predicted ATP-grasp superfamily ATP-dependent carboligase
MKPLNILIPDGESYVSLGVLQCLSEVRDLKIHMVSNAKITSMRFSRYVTTFIYQPKIDADAEWVAAINDYTARYSIDVIMPVDEIAARKLIRLREHLLDQKKAFLPRSLDDFDLARDKGRLAIHLERLGIPGPKTILYTPEFFERDIGTLPFPLLLKPALDSGGGKGIEKFDTEKELITYLAANKPGPDRIFQEFIEGYDLGCNVLCRDGEILAFTIQKGFLFEKKSFTPQIGLQMIHQEHILNIVKKLMQSLNWSGVANIDLRYDARRDLFRILEINPRFWLTVLGSSMAGVNFPFLYCRTALGDTFHTPAYTETKYLNFRGFYTNIFKNPLFLFKLKEIWNTTPLKYMLKDPFLNLYHVMWSFKNIIFGKNENTP